MYKSFRTKRLFPTVHLSLSMICITLPPSLECGKLPFSDSQGLSKTNLAYTSLSLCVSCHVRESVWHEALTAQTTQTTNQMFRIRYAGMRSSEQTHARRDNSWPVVSLPSLALLFECCGIAKQTNSEWGKRMRHKWWGHCRIWRYWKRSSWEL